VKALWARGNKAWDEGRYADAIVDYEEAATISQSPKAFYNLADSYERVGRKADALTWLERFKAIASRAELEQAPNLGKRIAILRNQVAVLKVNVNVVGARVLVRNTVVGTKLADRPLEVVLNEGRATIEISSEGYQPYQKEHTLRGGSALEIEVQLNQKAPSTIVLEKTNTVYLTSKPLWSRWWFWAGAGVLAAGGATAIVALSTDKATTKGDTTIITALPSKFNVHF
jgi:tetratricopeptide (TPR) repeat protein